ncbi:MAG: c-type cytochrome domain-containing protein [Planctomycetia bacterium]
MRTASARPHIWAILFLVATAAAPAAETAAPITFEDHVAVILRKNCVQCHGEGKQESGLNFMSYQSLLKGGSGGKVVEAGRSSASRLYGVITEADPGARMPPDADPLPAEAIAMIKQWIDTGLRENAGSAAMAVRTLGFKPATAEVAADAGPPPVPVGLAAVERPAIRRPFPVTALATSPRAAVAAVSGYGVIELVDPGSRQPLGALVFAEGEPLALRFSRSGRRLLAAGGLPVETGMAAVYDVVTGKRLAAVGQEPDAVQAADLSPDERMVAVGCTSRLVKVFSTETGAVLYTLDKHTDWVTAVAFSPDGRYLATGDRIGNIHLWEAAGGGVVLPLAEHKASIRGLAWRSDSGVVASCGEDGLIVWWDTSDGFPVATKADAHPPAKPPGTYGKVAGGVLDCCFGPAGELATCGRDRTVKLWTAEGRETRSFSLPDDAAAGGPPPRVRVIPTRVALTADGATVLAGDSAGRLHSWQTK